MKTLFKHILKPLNFLFYILVMGFIIFVFILFNTELGLRLSVQAIEKFSKGQVIIEQASGSLNKKIAIKKIIYTHPQQTFFLEDVALQWKPLALLEWRLYLNSLKVRKISIIKKPPQPSQKILEHPQKRPFSIPQLPIYLVIKNLDIGSISVQSNDRIVYQSKALKGHINLTRTQFSGLLNTTLISPFLLNTQLELSGHKNRYQFQLTLKEKGIHWKLAGQGDQTHLVFNTIDDRLFNGKLNLTGWIKSPLQEENLLIWKFSLTASNINLQPLFPALLNGTLNGAGQNQEGRLALNLAQSFYEKNPIDGEAMLRFSYPKVKAFSGEFKIGKNSLRLNGNIEDEWAIGWQANFNELSTLRPDLKGTLFSEGKISGPIEFPHISANLSANDLQAASWHIKNINVHAEFDMDSLDHSRIEIKIEQIKNGIYEISHLLFHGHLKETKKGFLLSLNLKPGNFQYPFESTLKKETFSGGIWNTLFKKNTIDSHFEFSLLGGSHFKGQALLPNPILRGSSKKIQAHIQGEVKNLSFLSVLTSPTVRNIHGQLTTDIQIGGTVRQPIIKSIFKLTGDAFLPVLNLHLNDIQLTAKGEKQAVIYEGQARSKNTALKLTGKTSFLPKEVMSQFKIFSDDFLLTNTQEIKIHIAPKINIESRNGKTTITGVVDIPQADIKPLDFTNIVTMPDDVVYVGKEEKNQGTFPVETNLLIRFGDHVYFSYQGLIGYLTGEINIKSSPMQPTVAFGRIKIKDGTYQIKGRKLTIHQGYLTYNGGSINNPGLQIQATRKIQVNNIGGLDPNMDFGISEMLVGVNLTGTLRRHQVKLFSEPSGLTQSNILAYLITGQSAQAGASAYLPLILEAADSLGGGTSSSFAEEIKKGFALTDISIQQGRSPSSRSQLAAQKKGLSSSSHSQKDIPTIVFGKALSPVFYISYAVNLIQPISGFQARYQLTKHWVLQISGIPGDKGASVDLIRSIESKD